MNLMIIMLIVFVHDDDDDDLEDVIVTGSHLVGRSHITQNLPIIVVDRLPLGSHSLTSVF